MKLVLAEPKYLKESISVISELVNEARLKIKKDAVELVAMDPANVAMVIFKLLSSSFVEYKVDKEESIAINLSNLKQILKRAKHNDMVTIELEQSNRLRIQLNGETIKTFSIPIIELEEKEQRIPELTFSVKVQTNSSLLGEVIEDADTVAESVIFSVDRDKLNVHAGEEMNKAHIEIKSDDSTSIVNDAKGNVRAKYSIEYLKKMMGGSKLSDSVTLQFGKDYPLKLDYKAVDRMMLSFILAPRVEND